jgi:ATP-dependent protease ClpP protease subunit
MPRKKSKSKSNREQKLIKKMKRTLIPMIAQATGRTQAQIAQKVKRYEHAQMRKGL